MNRKISLGITDVTNRSWYFEGLKELLAFIKTEAEYWQEKRDFLENNQEQTHLHLNAQGSLLQAIQTIESWESNLPTWDDNQLNQQLNQLLNSQLNMCSNWLWSGHPYSRAFVECHKKYGFNAATSFLDLIIRNQITNISQKDYFFGLMLAYEFLNQDSDLTKRSKSEKASLTHLRSQLEKETTQLIAEVESFKDGFSTWDGTIKSGWQDWLVNSSKDYGKAQTSYKDQFNDYLGECKNQISNLENTYQEKLRLEKPATYWNKAAYKYGIHGGLWTIALVGSVLLGIIYFREFYIA